MLNLNGLPSLLYHARLAHTIKQTPCKKMTKPLFGFAHPPPKARESCWYVSTE